MWNGFLIRFSSSAVFNEFSFFPVGVRRVPHSEVLGPDCPWCCGLERNTMLKAFVSMSSFRSSNLPCLDGIFVQKNSFKLRNSWHQKNQIFHPSSECDQTVFWIFFIDCIQTIPPPPICIGVYLVIRCYLAKETVFLHVNVLIYFNLIFLLLPTSDSQKTPTEKCPHLLQWIHNDIDAYWRFFLICQCEVCLFFSLFGEIA